jgi:hypothetical protein
VHAFTAGRIVIKDVRVCRRMTKLESVKTDEAVQGIHALILDPAPTSLPAFTS